MKARQLVNLVNTLFNEGKNNIYIATTKVFFPMSLIYILHVYIVSIR
jgi:hypothetical protein